MNGDQLRLIGNRTIPDTTAIVDGTVSLTIPTDAQGRIGYYTNRKMATGALSTNGPVVITTNALNFNVLQITDTEPSEKTIFFGPGVVLGNRVSLVDNTDGHNTELFACSFGATTPSCGVRALNVGLTGSGTSQANGTLIIGSGAAITTLGAGSTMAAVIGNGTATMATAAIGAGAGGTTVTVSATNVTTSDSINWAFSTAPVANPAELFVSAWPTANNVNFQYCNPTAGNVNPNAVTLNWRWCDDPPISAARRRESQEPVQ